MKSAKVKETTHASDQRKPSAPAKPPKKVRSGIKAGVMKTRHD